MFSDNRAITSFFIILARNISTFRRMLRCDARMNVCIYVTHVKVHRTRFADNFTAHVCERTRGKSFTSRSYERRTTRSKMWLAKRKEIATEGWNGITTAEIVFDERKKEEEEVLVRYVKPKPGGWHSPLCEAKFFSRVSSPPRGNSIPRRNRRFTLRESRVTLIPVGLSRLSFARLSYRAAFLVSRS